MYRLYAGIIAGGYGLALALEAAIDGHWSIAFLLLAMSAFCLVYGWFEFKDFAACRDNLAISRMSVDSLIKTAAKRSSESAFYIQALLDVREVLNDGGTKLGALEIIDDALAEFHDPQEIVLFCTNWLSDAVRAQGYISEENLLAPDTLVRSENGDEIALMFHYAATETNLALIAFEQGLEVKSVEFETDADEKLHARYFDDGESFDTIREEWKPTAPEGFKLAAKLDNEEGPVAIFVRRKPTVAGAV